MESLRRMERIERKKSDGYQVANIAQFKMEQYYLKRFMQVPEVINNITCYYLFHMHVHELVYERNLCIQRIHFRNQLSFHMWWFEGQTIKEHLDGIRVNKIQGRIARNV